ncbi:Succinoglycan biosynthesis protein ExoI [Pseudovibrio axinellae]|uniref:Succinoglycan biosynthesis protein ExoI n=1 Tax=Pseudovibrio axinellae TaxID=989403 RepID=A0A165YJV0_9HYPH|nr:thermonuclease family protein [Pseudovibrio axinellae]KZL18904.1 Succinoglycan biosynthesis protein ExoI [Pseudovibrio axinellae]SEP88302.1 nuclease homologue [Pseudovibrio axinellae]
MRITKTTSILLGAVLLATGLYALLEHNSDTALRGNARTLYRPSSFPIKHKKSEQQKQLELAALEAARIAAEAKIPKTPAKHPDAVRNVGGQRTPPPAVSGPLQRVAHIKAAHKPDQATTKEMVLHRPVALDGATLSNKKMKISLHHVQAIELSETCPSEDGQTWPCGIRARTALRAFIGQKRVTCFNMETVKVDEFIATCSVGKHDLATWLVKNGWAKIGHSAPDALKRIAERAHQSERGIWRSKLVHLKKDETITLVDSWQELEESSTSNVPLVMEGEPNIIWRPRDETAPDVSITD